MCGVHFKCEVAGWTPALSIAARGSVTRIIVHRASDSTLPTRFIRQSPIETAIAALDAHAEGTTSLLALRFEIHHLNER